MQKHIQKQCVCEIVITSIVAKSNKKRLYKAQWKICLFFNGTYFANVEVLGVMTKPAQVSGQLGCSKCLSLCRQTNLESKEHRFSKPGGFKLLVQLSYFLADTVQVTLLPDEENGTWKCSTPAK
jgi:hypothetical protein